MAVTLAYRLSTRKRSGLHAVNSFIPTTCSVALTKLGA